MELVSKGTRSSSIDNLSNFLSCLKGILQEPVTCVYHHTFHDIAPALTNQETLQNDVLQK